MAARKQAQTALPLGPQDLPEVIDYRRITDAATIKALADPLRLRIIRLMGEGAHTQPRNFTVKQLAAELCEPPTKLYRHVKKLLEVGLIQVAELRLVGGIVEQHYRVAQAGFAISTKESDLATDEIMAAGAAAIEDFLTRYQDALHDGRTRLASEDSLQHPPHVRSIGGLSSFRMPQDKAADFAERLNALVQELNEFAHIDEGVEVNMLTVFYATE